MLKHLRRLVIAVAPAVVPTVVACHQSSRAAPEPVAKAEAEARARIAAEQSIDVATLPERTVGVPPLRVDVRDTALAPLAYGLADLLMTDLARSRQLTVVDRLRLDAVLRELTLTSSGRVDTAVAPRVGKLLGARRLVVGALAQEPGGRFRVDAHIADVPTREVRGVVSATAPINEILDAEKVLAFRIFDQLGVTLAPAERAAVEQRPTKNIAALLAYSRGVRYEVEGRYADAARSYESATRLDPSFTLSRQRLDAVKSAAPGSGPAAGQLQRAASAVTDGVNQTLSAAAQTRIGGGAAEPGPQRLVEIIITITAKP